MHKLEAIIFDLGGVLLNIDFALTQQALTNLGMKNAALYFGKYAQEGFFDALDKGKIDEIGLYDELRNFIPNEVTNDTLRDAWNSMILDFPQQRIDLLKQLRKKYRLFLLSNTNRIHYNHYTKKIKELGEISYESLFDKAYFSFSNGMRKPEPDFFLQVLNENRLCAQHTLFIDDTEANIEQAISLGFQTIHLNQEMDVCDIFKDDYLDII